MSDIKAVQISFGNYFIIKKKMYKYYYISIKE